MDPKLQKSLETEDLGDVIARAAFYADTIIRKYIWRGFRPSGGIGQTDCSPSAQSAEDFVLEAFNRLLDGRRRYNPERPLLDNIKSIVESLISSAKKTSDRDGLVDHTEEPETEEASDPVSRALSPEGETGHEYINGELLAAQDKAFQSLRASLDGDEDSQAYLDAMAEEFYKPEEIAEVTGIAVEKVYEIRRKMKNYAKALFGVQNFGELKRKVMES